MTSKNQFQQQSHIRKNVACDILAPSAVAFMQHLPIARVRIHSGAFFIE
jgi:hypothetical protein